MQPEIVYCPLIETNHGEILPGVLFTVPFGVTLEALAPYVEETPEDWEVREGWIARLPMPGYLNCTDWIGPFDSHGEAVAALASEQDVCPVCWVQCWDDEASECPGAPCMWSYTDSTLCEHGEPACEECVDAERYDVGVLVSVAPWVAECFGAPGGSVWERRDEPYCVEFVGADVDVVAWLRGEGFAPEEVA